VTHTCHTYTWRLSDRQTGRQLRQLINPTTLTRATTSDCVDRAALMDCIAHHTAAALHYSTLPTGLTIAAVFRTYTVPRRQLLWAVTVRDLYCAKNPLPAAVRYYIIRYSLSYQ